MSRTHNNFEYIKIHGNESIELVGDATQWTDLRFAVDALQINPATAKPVFDYTNVGITFAQSGNETVVGIGQFPHEYLVGSDIKPHVHWEQTAAGTPKFQLEYTWYNNGGVISAFNTITTDTAANVFSYLLGTMGQITAFDAINGSGITGISSIIKFKLTRLTAGDGDTYTAALTLTEFDIHFQKDALGSNDEYTK